MQVMRDEAKNDEALRRFYMESGLQEAAAENCQQPYQIWAEFNGMPVRVLCAKDYHNVTSDPEQTELENTLSKRFEGSTHTDNEDCLHKANGQPFDSNLDVVKGLICIPMGIVNGANLCYLIATLQVCP